MRKVVSFRVLPQKIWALWHQNLTKSTAAQYSTEAQHVIGIVLGYWLVNKQVMS